jgi:hypothetical protein
MHRQRVAEKVVAESVVTKAAPAATGLTSGSWSKASFVTVVW